MSHIFNLKDVKSPWNGEYYIGFVLDVVNKYLDFNSDYYLPLGHGSLSDVNGMNMIKWNEKRKRNDVIRVVRVGEEKYCVFGFPEEKFSDFEERVQDLWADYYNKMDAEMKRLKNF